jgi:hypothetical protein
MGTMTSKPESLVALAIGHSTRTIEEFVRLLQAHAMTRLVDGAYGAASETQSSIHSRHFARLTEDHRHWLHAHGGAWRSASSDSRFNSHSCERRKSTEV